MRIRKRHAKGNALKVLSAATAVEIHTNPLSALQQHMGPSMAARLARKDPGQLQPVASIVVEPENEADVATVT